jgi:hypothetical protein
VIDRKRPNRAPAPYPIHAVRAVALHAQGLTTENGSEPKPTRGSIFKIADQLGAVQIDTLQVAARAHYLTIWSRLGSFAPADFDALAFDPNDRRMFEGWYHAACYIPTYEYRYQMPHQRDLREHPTAWYHTWLSKIGHAETINFVRERITREGGMKVSDFERGDHPAGSWWNWRPAKVALEYLYAFGELAIADRIKFQRKYDLTERVIPAWADRSEPTKEERDRHWVEQGAKALGVFESRHAPDYTWMKLTKGRKLLAELVKEGIVVEVQAEFADGQVHSAFVHRDNLKLLKKAADGALKAGRATFLNPFDNLFWAQGRDETFWNFDRLFEAYVPAPKRKYGYFNMTILRGDQLIGRFDPKVERDQKRLRLKALFLEKGFKPDDDLIADVALAMRDFMRFHHADDLVIDKSDPVSFGKKLIKQV